MEPIVTQSQPFAQLVSWLALLIAQWAHPNAIATVVEPRFTEYANDYLAVAFDPDEPPLFSSPDGRARTAALLASISSYESGFDERVDTGARRGDGGRSWCFLQVNLGDLRIALHGVSYRYLAHSREGWSGEDLVEDRQKCFRVGLHIARQSLRWCKNLSIYTTGRCFPHGETKATERMERMRHSLRYSPSPFIDEDVLTATGDATEDLIE